MGCGESERIEQEELKVGREWNWFLNFGEWAFA